MSSIDPEDGGGQVTLPATADPTLFAPGSRTQFESISHHLAATTRILTAAVPSSPLGASSITRLPI